MAARRASFFHGDEDAPEEAEAEEVLWPAPFEER